LGVKGPDFSCRNMTKRMFLTFTLLRIMIETNMKLLGDEMIRKGRFTVWGNKEFELVSYQRQYYLQSKDFLDLKNGFREKNGDRHVFIKPISVKEKIDVRPYGEFEYIIELFLKDIDKEEDRVSDTWIRRFTLMKKAIVSYVM
jgi:hypothetical protein